jgi:hypothetical protein
MRARLRLPDKRPRVWIVSVFLYVFLSLKYTNIVHVFSTIKLSCLEAQTSVRSRHK